MSSNVTNTRRRGRQTDAVSPARDADPVIIPASNDRERPITSTQQWLSWTRFYQRLIQTDAIVLLLLLYLCIFLVFEQGLYRNLVQTETTTAAAAAAASAQNDGKSPFQRQQQKSSGTAVNKDEYIRASQVQLALLSPQLLLHTHKRPRTLAAHQHKHKSDYGGLDLNFDNNTSSTLAFARFVDDNDWIKYEQERADLFKSIGETHISSSYYHTEELTYPYKDNCMRPNWTWNLYPSCTTMHEIALDRPLGYTQDYDIKYLSHGYFRDSWRFTSKFANDDVIYKRLRFVDDHDVDYYSLRYVQVEALIMERLTASPRIVDIYGHCGTSILAEPMPQEITTNIVPQEPYMHERGRMKQSQLDKWQKDDVKPLNNYTAEEKLDIALQMAEGLAYIHGYEGGLIIHGDVHPDQWLVSKTGAVKLNDFNNGHLMDYNIVDNAYCPYWTSFGGTYKTPEEFRGDYVNEAVDVWSMGHNIYGLLTGLWPFYDEFNHKKVREKVLNGELPYVDDRYRTRSYIEGRLVEAMETTWAYKPEDRADIFAVVKHLRETKKEYLRRQQSAN